MALISSTVLFLVSGTFFHVNQEKKARKAAKMRNTYGPNNSCQNQTSYFLFLKIE